MKHEDALRSNKARGLWRSKGDKCTRFFHKIVEARSLSNNLDHLYTKDRRGLTWKILENISITSIENSTRRTPFQRPFLENLNINYLSDEQSAGLEGPFIEEIKRAMDDLAGETMPGLDGFPVRFYQFCWLHEV